MKERNKSPNSPFSSYFFLKIKFSDTMVFDMFKQFPFWKIFCNLSKVYNFLNYFHAVLSEFQQSAIHMVIIQSSVGTTNNGDCIIHVIWQMRYITFCILLPGQHCTSSIQYALKIRLIIIDLHQNRIQHCHRYISQIMLLW